VRRIQSIVISVLSAGLLAGSAVGVGAQNHPVDLMAPATFEGSLGPQTPSTDEVTGLPVSVGTFEATDPRASGTWIQARQWRHETLDAGASYQVLDSFDRLVNAGGSWVGTTRAVVATELPGGGGMDGRFIEMVGEGDYEGLTMFILSTSTGMESSSLGFIIPVSKVPPLRNPPSGE
jgi:hypothetical protein